MKGSITIFATMSLLLVSQFVFTLLEGGRYLEADKIAEMKAETEIESIFAQYCKPLWDQYHILGYDAGQDGVFELDREKDFLKNLNAENMPTDVFRVMKLEMTEVEFDKFQVMTDTGAYRDAIVSYMKDNFAYEAGKAIYSQYQAMKDMSDDWQGDKNIQDALDVTSLSVEDMDISKSQTGLDGNVQKSEEAKIYTGTEDMENGNILTIAENAKAGGLLNLVVEDELSGAEISSKDIPSSRDNSPGNWNEEGKSSVEDKLFLNQYFSTYLSCFGNEIDTHGMKYEMEYLIGGRDSDIGNLEYVVNWMIILREAVNFAYLITDPTKQAEALNMATVISAIALSPEAIEIVKLGIMSVWAFAESLMDVRTLLAGEKIPIVKSAADWNCSLMAVPAAITGKARAKNSETGLSYSSFLRILMFFNSDETLAERAMDLAEITVRNTEGYENFRMDNCIRDVKVTMCYEYKQIFMSFVSLVKGFDGSYKISKSVKYSYY